MFKFLKNIFFTYFVCAILLSFVAHADSEESFAELSEELAEVTKDFNELDTSSLQEAAVIDNSIREINKAIEFAQQNIEDGNSEIALKTVTFVNKSLSDISSALPKSYDSNMDNADMASLGEEGLETVTTVVEGLGEKKEKDKAEMITTMLDINDSGFDAFEISRNLNSFGVNTIKVDLDVKTREEMSGWTREDWEAAWTGGVLTDDGKEIITDKEVEERLDSLNSQIGLIDEKNKLIEETEDLRKKNQNQLNVLRDQLNDLNKQKNMALNPILEGREELDKQIKSKQSEIDEVNSFIAQYNEDISNIEKQIENIQSQTSKIDGINSEIKTLTANADVLNKQTNDLNNKIQENNNRILQLQNDIETRTIVARNKKTEFESWAHNTITYEGRRAFDATLNNISSEQNISIDLANLTDEQRIEYYNQYQSVFDSVKTWPNTTNKLYVTDNLKLDGTASGFIERQKKVLELEKEYLAWERSVSIPRGEISTKITENDKINLELVSLKDQVQQNQNLVSVKQNELAAVEVTINKISLDDPRKDKIEKIQAEKISEINKIESEVADLNKEVEVNNNKLNTTLTSISSLQGGVLEANTKLNELNQRLISAESKKNLVSDKSRADINKEMDALNTYGHVFLDSWSEDVPDYVLDAELEYALKEPGILLSADPYEHSIFDLEKYGSIAGVSTEVINRGKEAILNNDLETQKEVFSQVINELSKNKNYGVSPMSPAEIEELVKEEQTTRELVNLIRSNPTSINFDLNSAPVRWNKGAVVPEALKDDVASKYNEIINSKDYAETLKNYEVAEKTIIETKEWIDQAQKTMTEQNLWTNNEIKVEYDKKFQEYMNAFTTQRELAYEVAVLQTNAQSQARDTVWEANNKIVEAQVKAVEDLNKMIDAKFSEYSSIDAKKANQVKNIVSKLSPNSGTLVIDPSVDSTAAEVKAALWTTESTATLSAYHIANDTRTKSFVYDPFSGTGNLRTVAASYNQDKTNVEIAAEVKSTLDGTYSGEYINGYMNAKYDRSQLEKEVDISLLSAEERKEFKEDLKEIFSEPDKKLAQRVDEEIKSINNEIKSIEAEKIDITKNIQALEKEIIGIQSSDQKLQKQITELNSELTKTENLFKDKVNDITDNINDVNAIDFQIAQLQSQKIEVQNKINLKSNELEERLAEASKTQNEIKTLDSALLAKQAEFDYKIDQVNQDRQPLLSTATSLVNELAELNNQVDELEKAKPIYEKQIATLEDEIQKLKNTKADLATAQAKNIGLEVSQKTVKSIPKMEDTAIIALNGPALVRVVDDSMLIEEAEVFKAPISEFSVNTQIFTAAAVRPEELFAVKNLTGEIKVALSEGTVKEINSGSLGIKMADVEVDKTQTAKLEPKNPTMTDASINQPKMSTSDSMNIAKSQSSRSQTNLRTVSTASSELSSITDKELEISGGYDAEEVSKLAPGTTINYEFNNVATAKASSAMASATTAAASSREAAERASAAAEAAQESAQAAAQAAAQSASRQAAEAAAMQAAQAAAAAQAQQAAQAAAAQASAKAASVAAQAAATSKSVASGGQSKIESLQAAAKSAKANQTTMAQKANQLAAEAAKPGATNAQKEAAAAAEAASQVAGNAKRAAEAAEFATRNAISQASVQAKAAAEQAAKEAAAAAALAAKDAAEQAAQEAAAVAAQAAKDAAVDAIEARIAELKSAISTVDTHDKIHSQIDYGVRSALASGNCGGPCDGQQKTYDHNYSIMQNAHDNWTKELAEEQQKLEDAKK